MSIGVWGQDSQLQDVEFIVATLAAKGRGSTARNTFLKVATGVLADQQHPAGRAWLCQASNNHIVMTGWRGWSRGEIAVENEPSGVDLDCAGESRPGHQLLKCQ